MLVLNSSSWNNPLSTDGSVFWIFILIFVVIGLLSYIAWKVRKGGK